LAEKVLLELDQVTKSFGGVHAVKSLSFSVNEGEILGLIGPNGAGKTTAFNLISGVYTPDSGQIIFDQRKISGLKPHKITQLGISRTFQTVRPFGRMTVLENVAAGSLFGKDHVNRVGVAQAHSMQLLKHLSLENKADVLARSLTLAEQRRLELGRAVAARPKLLMLDEVMAGLTQSETDSTLELLRSLKRENGLTLIVIEHVMKAMMKLCDRIVVMDHGDKIAEGEPKEVTSNANVIAAYMGEKSVPRSRTEEQG
jgi:branched-chain amino acid transport system ATP-binding protein